MTFAHTWFIWLIGLLAMLATKWRLDVAEEKASAKRMEMLMDRAEKMARHGGPALGLMPMVFRAGSARADFIDTIVVFAAAGFALLLICSVFL